MEGAAKYVSRRKFRTNIFILWNLGCFIYTEISPKFPPTDTKLNISLGDAIMAYFNLKKTW